MIDLTKCEFEEHFRDDELETDVYYFIYPEPFELFRFDLEPTDNVISMCISLSVYDYDDVTLQISPTVVEEDELSDVDWRGLCPGIDYDERTDVEMLLRKAKNER